MKRILLLVFLVASLQSIGQVIPHSITYAIEWYRIGGDTQLWIPSDTIAPAASLTSRAHIARKSNVLYMWNGTAYVSVVGAGGGAPAGNYGNLQMNRNSAFAVASTDSLNYTTAGGLSVTNFVNVAIGNSYKYNSVNAIRAITAKDNWHFGNSGNLTATGVNLISIGTDALLAATSGSNNIAIGNSALMANLAGQQNIAIGVRALTLNTTGRYGVAIGTDALAANVAAWYNVAVGWNSMVANISGQYNVGIGKGALAAKTTASENTAVGFDAMGAGGTGGSFNTAVGLDGLYAINGADSCTSIGTYSGMDNTTGNANTYVGANIRGITTGSRNTIIGANVTGLSATLANTVIVADGVGNKRFYANNSGAWSLDGGSTFGTSGYVMRSNGNAAVPSWVDVNSLITAAGLTIGTSTITSGATTRILYDNAGTLGEYTITGTGTVVAMQTSPSFITSVIGDATFAAFNTVTTNLSLGGAATTMLIGGTPTTAVTHTYSGNATATATTKTVNIAPNGASGSTTVLNLGSAVSGAATNIRLNLLPASDGNWDLYTRNASGFLERIANGATGTFLGANTAGKATWQDPLAALPTLASGIYTPTSSGEVNCATTMFDAQYLRVGSTVTVSGRFRCDAVLTATATSFAMDLPVASSFIASYEAGGVAFSGTIAGLGAQIAATASASTITVSFISTDLGNNDFFFSFTYQII